MTANDGTALYFAGGEWSRGEDLVATAAKDQPEQARYEDLIKPLGYAQWADIGDVEDGLYVPLTLTVYARDQAPRYLLSLEGNHQGAIESVYVQTLPDLMELLARWTPALQAAAVTAVLAQLNRGPMAGHEEPLDRGVVALLHRLTGH